MLPYRDDIEDEGIFVEGHEDFLKYYYQDFIPFSHTQLLCHPFESVNLLETADETEDNEISFALTASFINLLYQIIEQKWPQCFESVLNETYEL
mmetsp:Transcript_8/g.12  ORF Transcript_8/g.12 Transcript_8/m.12 type:complete len:94 (+) Transcript_8:361-642(+)